MTIPRRRIAIAMLVASASAFGAGWRGIQPGATTRDAVIATFGEPWRVAMSGQRELLVYAPKRAIAGTAQVIFRINSETKIVERVDVVPATPIDRKAIEHTYGPQCSSVVEKNCYVWRSLHGQPYMAYSSLQMAISLDLERKWVISIAYIAPDRTASRETPVVGQNDRKPSSPDSSSREKTASEVAVQAEIDSMRQFEQTANEELKKDPLQIGGLFYLRTLIALQDSQIATGPCCQSRFFHPDASAPFLIDAYFDMKPFERVRALVRPRIIFNPVPDVSVGRLEGGAAATPTTISATIDQLWLRFDAARSVYVTVGRQHVKWGVSRIWSPTDYLSPGRRNPITVFDERVGADMIKIHVPWEETGSNFYALGFVDALGPPESPLRWGGALRSELVYKTAELGLGLVFQQGTLPKYAADVSFGLGPVDVYGEVGLRRETPFPVWHLAPAWEQDPALGYGARFLPDRLTGTPVIAASGGLTYTHRTSEYRSWTATVEGFYQSSGYADSATFLPWAILQGTYEPFYFGKWYAAALLSYSGGFPTQTFSLTTIGNLSDQSFLSRFDILLPIMSQVQFEAFGEVPFGTLGGELRSSVDIVGQGAEYGGTAPSAHIPQALFRVGVGLRLSL